MIWMGVEFRFVAADKEVRTLIFHRDVGQFEDHSDHSRVNPAVFYPIAKNRIGLPRATPVKGTVFLALAAPYTTGAFEANVRSNDFVEDVNHLRMVDEQTGWTSGHSTVLGGEGFGIVLYSIYLFKNGSYFLWLKNCRAY